MKILLLEDNESIREAVASFLTLENHDVLEFGLVKDAKPHFFKDIDLYLLDIMLPDGNGYYLAKEIRKSSDKPIIFLTAKERESDKIMGFELGCDDYITKPFSLKELSLRINAVSRRTLDKKNKTILNFKINKAVLHIDLASHKIEVNSHLVTLTATEWSMFIYLIENRRQVLSKEQILENCLGYNSETSDRIVITHIKNIREKLGGEEWIETVRGFGYRFTGEE